ncbi:MAG: RluA family pseudouridine synthase [Deltaproteobacteria bacterium]|nr:RluA family pseudouridine synthase [Deltaproteobacteria bacterium]
MSETQNKHDAEKSIAVDAEHDRVRLDKSVKDLFDVPWSIARTWIESGKISVDTTVVTALDALVTQGATLYFSPNAKRPYSQGQFNPKCIVYTDSHLIVAYKPADILTVPYEEGDKNTFDMQLRGYLTKNRPKNAKRKGAMAPLMVVHRLDKLTSGLLVFPRTLEAKEGLSVQFREHSVVRHYLALVHGLAKSKTIKTHIMQDRGDGIRGSCETSPHAKVRRSQQGQLAITHVAVVELLKNASLVKCVLETGRTNQIRIHMAEQGHPLIGERTYMRNYKGKEIDSLRLMLHAAELGFTHPITGKTLHFTAPPPPHFEQMYQQLKITPVTSPR